MTIHTTILLLSIATGPAPSPPVTATADAPTRVQHPISLRADLGWNSLAGLGLRGAWAATPHLVLDVGAGYVLSGPKAGARARWNFMTTDFTPYVALGGIWSAGRRGPQTINQGADDEFTFHVGPAAYAQTVAGIDYQDRDGFTYSFELGWAQTLGHRDVHVIAGAPNSQDWSEVKAVAAGGPVAGASVGYAF